MIPNVAMRDAAENSVLPNFIIAGVSKAGTSSLFNYMAQHPQVCPSAEKETNHFLPLKYGEPVAGIGDYLRFFSHCQREPVVMEATPGYFWCGAPLVEEINRHLSPRAKVLIIFRDPVDRFYSYLEFERAHLRVPQGITDAEYLSRNLAHISSGTSELKENNAYWALESGRYADYLAPWLQLGERLRLSFFDDLVANAPHFVGELCDWLEIDSECTGNFDYRTANRTRQPRYAAAHRLALDLRGWLRPMSKRLPRAWRGLQRSYALFNERSRYRPERTEAVVRQLRAAYAEPNVRLARMLGEHGCEPLPPWLKAS